MMNSKIITFQINMSRLRQFRKSIVHQIRRYCDCPCFINSTDLKKVLAAKIPLERQRVSELRKKYGNVVVSEVNVESIYGGMRGVRGLIWEPSVLDEEEGIRFRGLSIPECREKLPKAACGGQEPLPEGLFWLLLTGSVPNDEQVKTLSQEWAERATVLPEAVMRILKNFPKTLHPMSQFSAAVTMMSSESEFSKAYFSGTHKSAYWESIYEDAMNLIARLPSIAAAIYKNVYKDGGQCTRIWDPCLDWSHNFALELGFDDPQFVELLRLYLTIHSDHEGGNVSAHATHLVGSALSDPYLAFAAGMNGLAGPIHGLANQEVLLWLDKLVKELGDKAEIDDNKIEEFCKNTLKSGRVIPGFGHAVLRKTDPRYTCQIEFGKKHMAEDKMFKIVEKVGEIVPRILKESGKVKNPWANVDAGSGVLLQHYGMKEMKFYTVLFGVARSLGVMANMIWARALGLPIERPKSISTDRLLERLKKNECSQNQ